MQQRKEATPYFLLTRWPNSTSLIGRHSHTHFSFNSLDLYNFLKSIHFYPQTHERSDLDFVQGGVGSYDKMQSVELDSTGSACWILRSKINTRWISHQRRHLDLSHCSWVYFTNLFQFLFFWTQSYTLFIIPCFYVVIFYCITMHLIYFNRHTRASWWE